MGSTATAAGTAAASSTASPMDLPTAYFTDALLRPDQACAAATSNDAAATAEVSRILLNGAAEGQIPDDDKAYLATIVSARTGLSEADARTRVDTVLKRIDDAKVAAQKAADEARKAAAAAAFGGSQRDEEEDLIVTPRI